MALEKYKAKLPYILRPIVLRIYKGLAIAAKSTLKMLLLRQLRKNACNLRMQHICS